MSEMTQTIPLCTYRPFCQSGSAGRLLALDGWSRCTVSARFDDVY